MFRPSVCGCTSWFHLGRVLSVRYGCFDGFLPAPSCRDWVADWRHKLPGTSMNVNVNGMQNCRRTCTSQVENIDLY